MSRGFTLIELMIGMMLGLVIAGFAFDFHRSFARGAARQRDLLEAQSTAQHVDAIIARHIRTAGAGFDRARSLPACDGTYEYGPIVFQNANCNGEPRPGGDVTKNDVEQRNPDCLMTVAFTDGGGAIGARRIGNHIAIASGFKQFLVGDIVVVEGKDARTGEERRCVGVVTGLDRAGGNGYEGSIRLAPGLSSCNNPPGLDECLRNNAWPSDLFRFGPSSRVIFRVNRSEAVPRLEVAYGRPGEPVIWSTLAEYVEDFQIALILDDGTVVGRKDNSIDAYDWRKVRAVRYSLVVRSRGRHPGPVEHGGGFEDGVQYAEGDQYLRRTVTNEITLRN